MHTNRPKAAPLACLIVCFWVASCGVTDSDSVQGPYDGQNNPDEDSASADTGAVEGPT